MPDPRSPLPAAAPGATGDADAAGRRAGLTGAKRDLLASWLRGQPGAAAAAPLIARRAANIPVPLSFPQQRIWFLDQLDPGSAAYNLGGALLLLGSLRVGALARAGSEIVRRHEVLRTALKLVAGEPRQVVQPWLPDRLLPVIDLGGLSGAGCNAAQAELRRLVRDEMRRPIELAAGSLLRLTLVRLAAREHVLLLTLSHAAGDSWSLGLILGELAALYPAPAPASSLPELPVQYADFALWQRQQLAGDRLAGELAYWRQQLQGAPPALELPADRPRPPVRGGRGALQAVSLPAAAVEPLQALAMGQRATLFAGLLAVFALLLSRLSGERTVVVGTPVANRRHVQLEKLVGFFANTLALRTDVDPDATFRDLLRRVGETLRGALAHQDLPFERLVEALQPRRDLARTPLFQVMLVLQNAPMPPLALPGLAMETLDQDPGSARFDLTLTLADAPGGLAGTLEYSSELFDRDRMLRLLRSFAGLAAAAAAHPDRHAAELPLLAPAEIHQVLREWNDTAADLVGAPTVHGLFAAQARLTPAASAVVHRRSQLSYAELDRASDRVAGRLRAAGITRGDLVGIAIERGLPLIAGLLAILKAGAAYLPLDPDYPAERLRFMVEDSGIAALLVEPGQMPDLGGGARRLELDGARAAATAGDLGAAAAPPATAAAGDGDLVYAIYTSGSTGRPKGALNVHGAVVNRLLWMQQTYRLTASDRVLQKTPCGFDVSVWELFWPLAAGATLVFADPGSHRDSAYLVRCIVEHEITVLHFVPSMLQLFLEEQEVRRCTSLRQVIASGEALSAAMRDRCLERLPGAALDNLYGPTEAAIDVSVWSCRQAPREAAVPIGRPIANLQLHVLDPALHPAPVGVPGELCIGGAGLGRGYLRRPGLTAERFIPDPCGGRPGARLYRTGDLARARRDGAIEFLGRIDHQVKVRGVRIELGEIEATLLRAPAVREVVVAPRPGPAGETWLVAWVAGGDRALLQPERLRAAAARELPEAMVPAAFVILDSLPLGAHGKVDRKALPDPAAIAQAAGGAAGAPPRDAREAAVAGIWSDILGVAAVGIHDDFFALGGHSIAAARMLQALRRAFHVEVPLRALFQRPTVAALAAELAAPRPGTADAAGLPWMSRDELAAEAEAAPRIEPPRTAAAPPDTASVRSPQRVLLTGATGFLGPFLLRELLVQLPAARVECLVRAADAADGARRVRAALAAHGLWQESFAGRVAVLPGDLALPRLGLAEREFDRLAAEAEAIYHNGAWVNLFLAYSTLRRANVGGTSEVLRLAAAGRPKPLHHVGTVSVLASAAAAAAAGAGRQPLAVVDETTPLTVVEGLLGGYSQSKWVAESLVRQAGERGVPMTVYRPGRIAPHAASGLGNADDLLFRLLRGALRLGAAPDLEMDVEMAPVDYVSGALVHLSRQPAAAGATYHLVHPQPVTWRRLLAALDDTLQHLEAPRGGLERLPVAAWEAAVRRAAESSGDEALQALLPFLSDPAAADETVVSQPRVDCRRTLAALAGSGWSCPPLDARLLGLYMRRFAAHLAKGAPL